MVVIKLLKLNLYHILHMEIKEELLNSPDDRGYRAVRRKK